MVLQLHKKFFVTPSSEARELQNDGKKKSRRRDKSRNFRRLLFFSFSSLRSFLLNFLPLSLEVKKQKRRKKLERADLLSGSERESLTLLLRPELHVLLRPAPGKHRDWNSTRSPREKKRIERRRRRREKRGREDFLGGGRA